MARDRRTAAEPHALVAQHVIDEPLQRANAARTPYDARVQADG